MEHPASLPVFSLVLLCAALLVQPPFTPHPAKQSVQQLDSTLIRIETRVFQLVNQYRQSHGLKAINEHKAIRELARKRALGMANRKHTDHYAFEEDVRTLMEILPYKEAAENVGSTWGYKDPAVTSLDGWSRSTQHRRTMLDNFDLTGVGVAVDSAGVYYISQIFIHSK